MTSEHEYGVGKEKAPHYRLNLYVWNFRNGTTILLVLRYCYFNAKHKVKDPFLSIGRAYLNEINIFMVL